MKAFIFTYYFWNSVVHYVNRTEENIIPAFASVFFTYHMDIV